jgi:hypothetical protein
MKADFENRLENALNGLAQFAPETKQEAAKMSTAQWGAFQDALGECYAIFEELHGSIRQNGTWIHVGRSAAEQVNNAVERPAQQN